MYTSAAARPTPLANAIVVARETTLVLGFAVSLAAASRIAVPLGFTPVPVTAQTFVVLVAGVLLGARRAGLGAGAYLVLGVAGIPWFATGGATLGYLVGFAVAGWVVGRAGEAGQLERRARSLAVMAVAHALIHLLGATWLALFLGVGPDGAFTLGVAPFLIGDALKVVIAGMIAPTLARTFH